MKRAQADVSEIVVDEPASKLQCVLQSSATEVFLQCAPAVVMIRPFHFEGDAAAAADNLFMQQELLGKDSTAAAIKEFEGFRDALRNANVEVVEVQDNGQHRTPDSIFPNNWLSMHPSGLAIQWPMKSEPRRKEKFLLPIVTKALKSHGFMVTELSDKATINEEQGKFLEGTGSMVLDHINRKVYAAISQRTDADLVKEFCAESNYKPVLFHSFHTVDGQQHAVYHTNVVMSIGATFAVICLDTITDEEERKMVLKELQEGGREVIPISVEQMNNFAGNILQLRCSNDLSSTSSVIAMSACAWNTFSDEQQQALQKHGKVVSSSLHAIEQAAGGSARCMLAECFLPKAVVSEEHKTAEGG